MLTHSSAKPLKCDVQVCTYACARSDMLDSHRMNIHDDTEKQRNCDMCSLVFKHQYQLNRHKLNHDAPKYECDLCGYKAHRTDGLLSHMNKSHNSEYVARRKKQEERVRKLLLDNGWQEWTDPDLLPPSKHFMREKRIDLSCVDSDDTWCFIDFVVCVENGYVFLEVDEHQHRFGYENDTLSCDMKRMNKVTVVDIGVAGGSEHHVVAVQPECVSSGQPVAEYPKRRS